MQCFFLFAMYTSRVSLYLKFGFVFFVSFPKFSDVEPLVSIPKKINSLVCGMLVGNRHKNCPLKLSKTELKMH